MESNEFEALQRTAERAEAAPWVDFPPTPGWYPPAVGVWAALITVGLAEVGGAVGVVALVLAGAAAGAFVRWYRRYRGTEPTGMPPVEMRRAMLLCVAGLLATVAVVTLLAWQLPTWVAALAALVLAASLVWRYERAYSAAAAAARDRLR